METRAELLAWPDEHMPQSLVHLSAIVELLDDGRVPPRVSEALQRRPQLAKLGAILPDLPYFSHIRRRALRNLLGLAQAGAPWALRMHGDHPLALGVALLQPRSQSRMGPLPRLALAAGFFSHAALDTALHPLVYRLIDERGGSSAAAQQRLHLQIEKVQGMLFLDGRWREARRLLPIAQLCDLTHDGRVRRAIDHVSLSLGDIYGRSPTPAQIEDWVAGLAWYGRQVEQRPQQAEGGPVDVERLRGPWFDEPDVAGLLERGLARARRWYRMIDEAFAPGDVLPGDLLRLADGFARVDLDCRVDPFADEESAAGEL